MSKIQRRNNQEGVTHVADLLPTGRALAPREPVRCDLPPVAQNLVDASPWLPPPQERFGPWVEFVGSRRPLSVLTGRELPVPGDAIVCTLRACDRMEQKYRQSPRPAAHLQWSWSDFQSPEKRIVAYCVLANPVDAAKLAFDRRMADALRHDSDSEGGHAD